MRTVVASRPDRAGTLRPPADGAERGENRCVDLDATQAGQWKPTEAECMQRAQMRRLQRWHRTPARFSGCQWQTSASGGDSIRRTVPAYPTGPGAPVVTSPRTQGRKTSGLRGG